MQWHVGLMPGAEGSSAELSHVALSDLGPSGETTELHCTACTGLDPELQHTGLPDHVPDDFQSKKKRLEAQNPAHFSQIVLISIAVMPYGQSQFLTISTLNGGHPKEQRN